MSFPKRAAGLGGTRYCTPSMNAHLDLPSHRADIKRDTTKFDEVYMLLNRIVDRSPRKIYIATPVQIAETFRQMPIIAQSVYIFSIYIFFIKI